MRKITSSSWFPWLMLFSRTFLFAAMQALFALGYGLVGTDDAWVRGADWWPITVALADGICLLLLLRLYKSEGQRYWDLFHVERGTLKNDLLVMLGFVLLAAPVSFLPNILLGKAFLGSAEASLTFLLRPLPLWAVAASTVLFPLGQALSEIGLYFGYVHPRLVQKGTAPWLAFTATAALLSLQHIAVPLLFDVNYLLWRALMFLPFAILVGIAYTRRPRLMPYLAVIHALMNMSLMIMAFGVAY